MNDNIVATSNIVLEEMIRLARVGDDWHFVQNLNAMMRLGYCRNCGLTPEGCKREGCGSDDNITEGNKIMIEWDNYIQKNKCYSIRKPDY